MTTTPTEDSRVRQLLLDNLFAVFGEHDPKRRMICVSPPMWNSGPFRVGVGVKQPGDGAFHSYMSTVFRPRLGSMPGRSGLRQIRNWPPSRRAVAMGEFPAKVNGV